MGPGVVAGAGGAIAHPAGRVHGCTCRALAEQLGGVVYGASLGVRICDRPYWTLTKGR